MMIRLIAFLVAGFNWLWIVASPTLLGGVIGFLIYLSNPTPLNKILAGLLTLAGLTIGILWASKIWKKQGTVEFMSRVIATPELNKKQPEE